MGVFDCFAPLNDIIQVIYHSTSCFVLISTVGRASWTVELGLVGEGGRWWRGSWSETDVYRLAGSNVSEKALEKFSTRLTNWIIAGELAIEDWSAEKGAEIKLNIDPAGTAPVVVPLVELSDGEGSVRAITILKRVALQAQTRQCRINGPVTLSAISEPSKPPKPTSSKQDKDLQKAQERIKRLETEVNQAKQAAVEKTTTSPSTVPRPPPGASRGNPTRQKRKIVEAEFESD